MSEPTSLRVLWLSEKYPPARGGMAESCDRIVHGLRSKGVIVDLVHFSRRYKHFQVKKKQGGRLFTCPKLEDSSHYLNRVWNFLQLESRAENYTHVVGFGGVLPLVAGPVFGAWMGAPFIAMMRGNDLDLSVFHPKRRDMLQDAFARASQVCVVSSDARDKIERLYPGTPVQHVPNGIDVEKWDIAQVDLNHARSWRSSRSAPRKIILGMIGQFKPKKGLRFFLQALLDIKHAERCDLLVVGDVEPELEHWIDRQDFSAYREPYCDHAALARFYLASDYVIIPSFYDGMPNTLLEAAALGRPFIASTAGGMGDLLEDGKHGYLFAPGDSEGCRIAIDRALRTHEEDRDRMGMACRDLVRNGYESADETAKYHDLLLMSAIEYARKFPDISPR